MFYLDPPYWGCEDDYGKAMFAPKDFDRLAAQLKGIKGRFLMSINDVPKIRELFAVFDIKQVKVSYSVGVKAGRQGKRGVAGFEGGWDKLSSHGQALNPAFSNWMMGWPMGWTDPLGPLTGWYQRLQRGRLRC